MTPSPAPSADPFPGADAEFFRIFIPYEIRLARRRAMGWGSTPREMLPPLFLGLFLVRLVPAAGQNTPGGVSPDEILPVLRTAIRDSDIVGALGDDEYLAVVHDLDPDQSYAVAQRLLSLGRRSPLLTSAGLTCEVGFVVYPLTTQPNFPGERWPDLVALARKVGRRDPDSTDVSCLGILRGTNIADADIPETDLVDLASQDLDSLVSAGLIRLQRIRLMPAP